jgi:hypothetical protein
MQGGSTEQAAQPTLRLKLTGTGWHQMQDDSHDRNTNHWPGTSNALDAASMLLLQGKAG